MPTEKKPLPEVVSPEEWQSAVDTFVEKEKELTRARDALNAQRRRLPMRKVDKDYRFQSDKGELSLLDLFEGRKQLIVYHFMFGPDWDAGCPGYSWVTDAMTHPAHFHARDTSFVLISRAPLEKLQQYRKRMEWNTPIPWYSSLDSDFNYDFGATVNDQEIHGVSIFLRDGDDIYQTYHTGARGVEYLGSHWTYLDLTPYGRQEAWEDSPEGWPQTPTYEWQKRHDEYE
ncbi:DUF899 domain-containing protein [Kangiella shandongensis]|uniref:DUF899 domain-containing protein n=1 Tax=Kangiella shandongensis TaxID=2763258 RepID=UPI001CBF401C|nr:DUF899 domain-containing protein [Kangiella shandongensis]